MTSPMTQPSRTKRLFADSGLLYAAAIWGGTFTIVKSALADIDPVILVGYRFLFAGGILLIWLAVKRKSIFTQLRPGLILAAFLWLLYIPQTIGLGITTASNSGFITGMFIAFVPFLLKLLFRRTPRFVEIIASAVALSGLWILTGGMRTINLGDGLTLITAMAYALHLVYADKFMKSGIDPYVATCQQFLFVGAASLIVGGIAGTSFAVGSIETIWVIIFLALFPTLSAFLIQMVAQRIATPVKVSLIFALEPVFAAIFAWTIGGEPFVLRGAIGGGLIFVALIMSGIPVRRVSH